MFGSRLLIMLYDLISVPDPNGVPPWKPAQILCVSDQNTFDRATSGNREGIQRSVLYLNKEMTVDICAKIDS